MSGSSPVAAVRGGCPSFTGFAARLGGNATVRPALWDGGVTSSPEPPPSVTALSLAPTATVFLELWKRQRATVVTDWDLYRWDEEEVRMSPFLLSASLVGAGLSWTYRKDTSQGPPCPA